MGNARKGPPHEGGEGRDSIAGRSEAKDATVQMRTQNPASGNPLSRELQARLGREVRALFDGVAQEPIPNLLQTLLNNLRQRTANCSR